MHTGIKIKKQKWKQDGGASMHMGTQDGENKMVVPVCIPELK